MNKKEKDLIKEITKHLDAGADNLDPGIRSKITAARHAALEQKSSFKPGWTMPLAGVAAAAAAYLIFTLVTGPVDKPGITPGRVPTSPQVADRQITDPVPAEDPEAVPRKDAIPEDTQPEQVTQTPQTRESKLTRPESIDPRHLELVELLASDSTLDLYENIEFYTWLAENPENLAGS